MKLSAISLTASLLMSASFFPTTAYAWMPCQLICDTQCIGTEMAIQSVKTLQSFRRVQQSFVNSSSKVKAVTQSYKKYGDNVSSAMQKVGKRVKDLVVVDKPLTSSITGRTVQNINALAINWERQVMMYNSTLQTTQLSLENQISTALNAIIKLTSDELIRSQTSHITSQFLQNTGNISSYYKNRMKYLNENLPQTIALKSELEKVNGKTSFKGLTKKDAINYVSKIIFGQEPLSEADWKKFGYLGYNSANALIASSAYDSDWNILDEREYSKLDHNVIVMGSRIDLQGMRLLKSISNNVLMMERLKNRNLIMKRVNHE